MGAAASTQLESGDHPNLTKGEIKQLFRHLTVEYERKVLELHKSRDSNCGDAQISDLENSSLESASHAEELGALPDSLPVEKVEEGIEQAEVEKGDGEKAEIDETVEEKGDAEVSGQDSNEERKAEVSAKRKLYDESDVKRKLMELIIDEEPGILAMKVKVNAKVLGMLGDSNLDARALSFVDKSNVNKKVIATLGAACMMPEKALKRLGDDELSADQRRAMRKSEEDEQEKRLRKHEADVKAVVSATPTKEAKILRTQTRINDKAIQQMGGTNDEELMSEVRKMKTKDMTVNSKAVALMGEVHLVSDKVAKRRGSEMHADQRQRMLAERAKEEKARAKLKERQKKMILESGPTEEQLEVSEDMKQSAIKSSKLLKLAGTAELLPDKVKGMLGDEMSAAQKKKQHEAE